jgi:hypothetical protein
MGFARNRESIELLEGVWINLCSIERIVHDAEASNTINKHYGDAETTLVV